MKDKRLGRTEVEILREKLNKMLEANSGKLSEDIIEVSQMLDELILEELKKHNYIKNNLK